MPSVMWLVGALAGIDERELRATFNAGIGMVLVVAPETASVLTSAAPEAIFVGEVAPVAELGGRYVEGRLAIG
jgi:phosphoribosylaminoimidazole (AIR) synthetase